MFGLSFLYPLFLIAAAAAAVPIVLHLLRRKTEVVVDFPAVRLLNKSPVEQQRRRRLRELILLALRVAALAAARVGVRAAVSRSNRRHRPVGDDRGRARYIDEPVGARPVRSRAAGGTARRRRRARHAYRGARDLCRCGHAGRAGDERSRGDYRGDRPHDAERGRHSISYRAGACSRGHWRRAGTDRRRQRSAAGWMGSGGRRGGARRDRGRDRRGGAAGRESRRHGGASRSPGRRRGRAQLRVAAGARARDA